MSHHVVASFEALFPHVKLGGLYVVEDLATAYWPSRGGDPDPSAQYRTIDLVKSLVDGLHQPGADAGQRRALRDRPFRDGPARLSQSRRH
jgi:hypothetical protein